MNKVATLLYHTDETDPEWMLTTDLEEADLPKWIGELKKQYTAAIKGSFREIMREPTKNKDGQYEGPTPSDKVKLDFVGRMSIGEIENFYEYYLFA